MKLRPFVLAFLAPVAVLILHAVLARYGLRKQCDHLLHFLGGLSIACFLHQVIHLFAPRLGSLTPFAHSLLTFTSSCTVALFWEIGEFASDRFLRTHIQLSISETLFDLIYGTLGALTCFLIISLARHLRPTSTAPGNA